MRISILLLLGLLSCTSKPQREKPKQQTPAALNDERSYSAPTKTKRGEEGNLVARLYDELAEKDSALQRLENNIQDLQNSQSDSAAQIWNFKSKMENYYTSTDYALKDIRDSVLREKMKILITRNMERYNSRMEKNNELLKTIDNKNIRISDLHVALKITQTLPVIEKYQKQNLPATKPLDGYIRQQDKTLHLLDTLLEKH